MQQTDIHAADSAIQTADSDIHASHNVIRPCVIHTADSTIQTTDSDIHAAHRHFKHIPTIPM